MPPVVSNMNPVAGSAIPKNQPITFDVTGDQNLKRVVVVAFFGTANEVVFDGTSFADSYATSSSSSIVGGLHFSVVRSQGWPIPPTLWIDAVDAAGNEG